MRNFHLKPKSVNGSIYLFFYRNTYLNSNSYNSSIYVQTHLNYNIRLNIEVFLLISMILQKKQ